MKEIIYKLNEDVTKFYQGNLHLSEVAQEYLKSRKINDETIEKFKIGYAGSGKEVYKYLIEKGYTNEEIEASTICRKTEDGNYIDIFNNRIILPIFDEKSRIIAFEGRVLDDSKPKYITSPENIVYSKGENLFGINIAKNYCKEGLIVVEGYIDAISLHQRGIKNVVALLGTAITEKQIQLIKQYTNNVIVVCDSDEAGKHATFRIIDSVELNGMNCRIAQFECSKDPDEYINKYGADQIKTLFDNSVSSMEFKKMSKY